ncbi:putative DCC family thiol-disulfide oxidoreductase YuxK [Rhodanobacter sp. ANJX3]|uniref:thiol-disulfide oxidoreductase DCC family protein n=1 Tax=Rhodanobacter sp. ANJX3 TaxID=2723083 RepID=UPI001619EAFC|nr:thiol-disulfide oxidoreductase DCC family protein [Rhodanobacter sp. ANJX3]MBB5359854.1 putative DCC family thiol-disulfide oxidoreductase YuxK [Rhodanobacter sp. ANJX3]
MNIENRPIVVFDGVCLLCNRWVDFLLRHDRVGRYRLAAMQGNHGRRLLLTHGLSADDPSSFLLVEDGLGFTDTEALTRVLAGLGRGWQIVAWMIRAVPRFVRDPTYRWVARHRYRLFGRRTHCRLPDPAYVERFLD